MDGDPPSLSSVINQSYGDPVKVKSHKMFQVTCLEDDDKKADRMKLQVQLFDELNDIRLSLSDRLANFQRLEHGFALVVRKGEEVDEPHHIFFISAPVLARVDTSDRNHLRAQTLGKVVSDHVAQLCVPDPSQPNHFLLGSTCGHSLGARFDQGRDVYVEQLMPVYMTDGKAVGRKPLNGDSWQILHVGMSCRTGLAGRRWI
jgi:hypothetical protein